MPQGNAVTQLIQCAHIGGFYFFQRVGGGVAFKEIIKQAIVIEIFRNGDFQDPGGIFLLAKAQGGKCQHGTAQKEEQQDGQSDIAHAGGQTNGHGQENGGDFPGGTGGGAEPHQAERAGYGNASPDAAIDQHDDRLYHRRQDGQCDGKALGAAAAVTGHQRGADPQQQGYPGAKEKRS